MSNFVKIVVRCMLVLLSLPLYGSENMYDSLYMHFDTFTTKDGLSQGMVRCIYQDKQGLMWFATKDGLNKYDGYKVIVYRHQPNDPLSLPENYITQIIEDDSGNCWVGTVSKGLWIFDKKNERFYQVVYDTDSSLNGDIRRLEYRQGILMVVTVKNVAMFDVRNVSPKEHYRQYKKIPIQSLFNYEKQSAQWQHFTDDKAQIRVAWLSDNSLWVSVADSIVVCKSEEKRNRWKLHSIALSHIGLKKDPTNVTNIVQIKNKKAFVVLTGRQFGYFNMTAQRFEFLGDFDSKNNYVLRPVQDAQGNIRFNVLDDTYLFNPINMTVKKIIHDKKIHTSAISSCIDSDGFLWTGSQGFGVLKSTMQSSLFTAIDKDYAFVVNNTGNKGVIIRRNKKIQSWTNDLVDAGVLPKEFARQKINQYYTVKQDNKGVMWFVKNNKEKKSVILNSYNPKTKQTKEYPIFSTYTSVNLYMCDDMTLALTTTDEHKRFRFIVIDCHNGNVLSDEVIPRLFVFKEYQFISHIIKDKKGQYWLGALDGLLCYQPQNKQWKHWHSMTNKNANLSADMIFSLCLDPISPEKYLWVGTNGGGLNRFTMESGECIAFSEHNGLPNNVIYGIVVDGKNNLWLSTNRGISCLRRDKRRINKDNIEEPIFVNFGTENGLGDYEFNRYEFASLATGEIVFGGLEYLTIFNPKKVLQYSKASPLLLTNIKVINTDISFRTHPYIIDKAVNYIPSIKLPYDKAYFTLDFALLQYSDNRLKHYQYYIAGLHNTWIDNQEKNSITFAGLHPGNYTLYVKGRNNVGVWSSPRTVYITIIPLWWQTWWFRYMLIVGIVVGLYGVYKYRLRQALALFSLRNSIASDLHDEIGSTLSSIAISANLLRKRKDISEHTQSLVSMIEQHAQSSMEAMSDIVWAINTKNDKFSNTVERIVAFAVEVLEPKQITLSFSIDEDFHHKVVDMTQRKNIYLFFKEVIHNIAKHAESTQVSVVLRKINDNTMLLSITDNGKGFNDKGEDTHTRTMGGNGIANLYERARQLRSECSIESRIGIGTTVTLTIRTHSAALFKPLLLIRRK